MKTALWYFQEKILLVKSAEAEAESKYLSGQG
jgi:hypothetical protein